MKIFHKRKIGALVLATLLSLALLFGCSPAIPPITGADLIAPELLAPTELLNPSSSEEDGQAFAGLSVHYLDVGQGDCTLICFPDGKNMMIDCGNGSASSVDLITTALKVKKIEALDYVVLTHPDVDHLGSVAKALSGVSVANVYHPDIPEGLVGFEGYYSALEFLKSKGAECKISLQGVCLGEDYKLAILSPTPKQVADSSYREFILASQPTETQINDLSPYIYLEYKGYRFLFTGDCSSAQEDKLLTDYDSAIFNKIFKDNGVELKLEDIDFLKVAHHGAEGSTSEELLDLLKPKHAVISVSGDNVYGHPATSVQTRLIASNDEIEILRTDVKGTISVFINQEGAMAISPQDD